MKPKILLFAGGYLPAKTYGGPVISISNIIESLGDLYNFRVIAVNHEKNDTKPLDGIKEGWNRVGKADVLYVPYRKISYSSVFNTIKVEDPDMIYLNSLFCTKWVLPTLLFARKHKTGVLIAPRGQLLENAIRRKRLKKIPYIFLMRLLFNNKNIYWQSTCEEETLSIKKWFGVSDERILRLDNLPRTIQWQDKKEKKQGHLKLVFISRIHPIKNLHIAIQAAQKLGGNVEFDIYGPVEDKVYWQKCEDLIKNSPPNVKITYRGILDYSDVPEVLSRYHAFILPSETENYGHAIVEALLSGIVVIISNNTPWSSAKDYRAGYVIDGKNIQGYAEALNEVLQMDNKEYDDMVERSIEYIKKEINLEQLVQKYINAFNSIINAVRR